jgi:hypothetical protein
MRLAGWLGGRRSGCSTLLDPTRSRLSRASRTRHLPVNKLDSGTDDASQPQKRVEMGISEAACFDEVGERARNTYALLELLMDGV